MLDFSAVIARIDNIERELAELKISLLTLAEAKGKEDMPVVPAYVSTPTPVKTKETEKEVVTPLQNNIEEIEDIPVAKQPTPEWLDGIVDKSFPSSIQNDYFSPSFEAEEVVISEEKKKESVKQVMPIMPKANKAPASSTLSSSFAAPIPNPDFKPIPSLDNDRVAPPLINPNNIFD